jgi:plasmid stabilization system protein ParE
VRHLTFHQAARRERTEAKRYYGSDSPAAAVRFDDELNRTLSLLDRHPEAGVFVLDLPVRSLALRDFPYSVIYRYVDETVYVLAIAHHKRQPGYWLDRTR